MRRGTVLVIAAIGVIVVMGVVLSQFASSEPDGLEYVSEEQGFADTAEDHTLSDAPLADYGGNLEQESGIATAIAGIVGLVVTGVIAVGLFWILRARPRDPASSA